MEALTLAAIAALALKATSLLKYLAAGAFRQSLETVVPWVAGFVILLIAAQADVAAGVVVFGDRTLGSLDVWSLLIAGTTLGATGSVVYDVKSAIDNTDTAKEPPLGVTRVVDR